MFAARGLSCSFCRHKAAPEVSPLHASQPCALCVVKQKVSVLVVASCPGSRLREGPWWHRGCVYWLAGRRAACCFSAPRCPGNRLLHTAPPAEMMQLWLTIMGSGRIDGRQERGAREILPELPVTDQELWHHSPVIPAALGLGPVTADAPWRERCCGRHRGWQPRNGDSPAHSDYIYVSLPGWTQALHSSRAICKTRRWENQSYLKPRQDKITEHKNMRPWITLKKWIAWP